MKSTLKRLCLTAIVALVSLNLAPIVSAEESKLNLMHVSGFGQYPVSPDVGELVLGIEADSKSAAEAQTKASAVLASFIGQLKGLGINANEIKTTESSLQPVRDYSTNKPPYKILSYTAVQKIRIRVLGEGRLNLISRAIDLATKNSINRIESVNFTISPELNREASRKALAIASEDALKSGQEVLQKLGLNLVRIKEIQLNATPRNQPIYQPMVRNMMAKDGYAQEAAPEISNIMPGELTIDANANLTIEFAGK